MSKRPFEEVICWALITNPAERHYSIVPHTFTEKYLPKGWELHGWDNSRVKLEWEGNVVHNNLESRGWSKISFEDLHPETVARPDETLEVEKTKSGLPAIWERGGATGAGGKATIVTDKNGNAKKPLFIRNHGDLANEAHALFVLNKGDHVIDVQTSYGEPYKVRILKVVGFQEESILDEEDDLLSLLGGGPTHKPGQFFARCQLVGERNGTAWWPELPSFLEEAYKVAVKKANSYHCRTAMYVIR